MITANKYSYILLILKRKIQNINKIFFFYGLLASLINIPLLIGFILEQKVYILKFFPVIFFIYVVAKIIQPLFYTNFYPELIRLKFFSLNELKLIIAIKNCLLSLILFIFFINYGFNTSIIYILLANIFVNFVDFFKSQTKKRESLSYFTAFLIVFGYYFSSIALIISFIILTIIMYLRSDIYLVNIFVLSDSTYQIRDAIENKNTETLMQAQDKIDNNISKGLKANLLLSYYNNNFLFYTLLELRKIFYYKKIFLRLILLNFLLIIVPNLIEFSIKNFIIVLPFLCGLFLVSKLNNAEFSRQNLLPFNLGKFKYNFKRKFSAQSVLYFLYVVPSYLLLGNYNLVYLFIIPILVFLNISYYTFVNKYLRTIIGLLQVFLILIIGFNL